MPAEQEAGRSTVSCSHGHSIIQIHEHDEFKCPPKPESLLEVTVCANGSGNSEYKDIAKDRKAGEESVFMLVQGSRPAQRLRGRSDATGAE
jgi:hypothetical protein